MRFVCNLGDCRAQPVEWAAARQAEGWDGLLVSDHLWVATQPGPHVWSVLGAFAAATSGVTLGTGFANNLLRHPIEFAQASLTMQRISGGRFEAGIGAGWAAEEMLQTGRDIPPPAERADRLIETVQLVRELFDTGTCNFRGRYYQVEVSRLERLEGQPPPALVAGVGGRRVIKSVAPLVDKLEVMPAAVSTRGGSMDLAKANAVTRDDVRALVDLARSTRADLPIRLYIACCAGDDERTKRIASMSVGFFGEFQGSPSKVADAVLGVGDLGIDEVHLSPSDNYTFQNLAPLLVPAGA